MSWRKPWPALSHNDLPITWIAQGVRALANMRMALIAYLAELDDRLDTGLIAAEEHANPREAGKRRLIDVMMLMREETGEQA